MSIPLYRRSPSAMFSEVGEDVVALRVENGSCYGMEGVTAVIWGLLAEPVGVPAICDRLLEMYEVEPGVCQSEVEEILNRMRLEGLVETAPSAVS